MLAETESPCVANVTMIFNSVPSTLIAPTHGPSGDWDRDRGAIKRRNARNVTLRGFMGEDRRIGEEQAFASRVEIFKNRISNAI
jgi:hypothetical protein